MRIEVTVVAGPMENPVVGYQKVDFAPPPENEEGDTGYLLDVAEKLKGTMEEARASIDAQVRALAAGMQRDG